MGREEVRQKKGKSPNKPGSGLQIYALQFVLGALVVVGAVIARNVSARLIQIGSQLQ